jgi:hypothetical protein
LEDSTFIWHSEWNFVHVRYNIFRKDKRIREEDEEEEEEYIKEEPKHTVYFKVEGSESLP